MKLLFDAASNKKEIGIRVFLMFELEECYPITTQHIFYCSNNMFEYEPCFLSLRLATNMGIQEPLVLGDSDLLVHQIQGEWGTCDPKLILYQHCLQISLSMIHVGLV